jgi:hypothetical protein
MPEGGPHIEKKFASKNRSCSLLFALPPVSTHAHREQPQPHTAAMGNAKKESVRKERQGKTGDGMGNVKVKGENFYRYVHVPLPY